MKPEFFRILVPTATIVAALALYTGLSSFNTGWMLFAIALSAVLAIAAWPVWKILRRNGFGYFAAIVRLCYRIPTTRKGSMRDVPLAIRRIRSTDAGITFRLIYPLGASNLSARIEWVKQALAFGSEFEVHGSQARGTAVDFTVTEF